METNTLQELDVKNIVKLNIKVTHFLGYFFPEFDPNSPKKILYFIYATTFVGCTFVLSLISQILYMIYSFGDVEKMTQASFLLFTNIVQCLKLYSFMGYSPRIWKLLHQMNDEVFKPQSSTHHEIIQNQIKISNKVTKLFLFGCTMTCLLWGISPFFDKRGSSEIRLPLSGWYPFSTEESPNFEFVYFYQMFTTWIGGLGDLSMDTFMSGTIMFVSAQLSLLNDTLENIEQNFQDFQELEVEESVNCILIRSIIHYRHTIEFSREVMYLFSAGITGQFVVGVIIVCISMFQMSLVSVSSFQFFAMTFYLMCMLAEIFLFCFCGNEVILKSEKLTESAYLCRWIDAPAEFKKNLIIFMTRTQFPLKLFASGYFTLSLETFKAVTKSSWSYFVVLKHLHDS